MAREIYTIGHSTRPIEDFIALLTAHDIKLLADVRSIPHSRHNPQFEQEALRASLKKAGVEYQWMKALGGRRTTHKDSPNTGWRNLSFRGYADYMGTEAFGDALSQLEKVALKKRTAIMCAEAVPWRCHRSLISDALAKRKWVVKEITSKSSTKRHRLTPFLKVQKGILRYPTSIDKKGGI